MAPGADQAQRCSVQQIPQARGIVRELVQRREELPAQHDERHGRDGRSQQAGEQYPEIGLLAAGSALRRFQTEDRPTNRLGDEGSEHAADAGEAQGARFRFVELELVGHQRADAAAGVGQRRFGAEAAAGDERHESSDHNPGGVAIAEAAGFAEFLHQFGKDGVVVAEELDQQPDQQAAEGTDQDSEEARAHSQRRRGLFPNRTRADADEGHKGKGDQGADQAEHGDKRHELDVGSWVGLWINHDRTS